MPDPQHVFAYGSLMFPEIWADVVQGEHDWTPAVINGFARFAVPGKCYPGLARTEESDPVAGVLYLDVSNTDLARLDRFEGREYVRIRVTVQQLGGDPVPAWTYLYRDPAGLSFEAWDPAHRRAAVLQAELVRRR